jgi:SNF2 family DNA or RNA helicase
MLQENQMFPYQVKAVEFQCDKPASALWLDMGLGKTVITLTSIAHLIKSDYLQGVLIVAPIRVIKLVWRQEALKWHHTKDLTFSSMVGNKNQRTTALMKKADIYLINYENLKWLSIAINEYFIKTKTPLPFDGIVWDEISKMKNSNTKRVKAYKQIAPSFKWTTGLTGTPASNGYKDLHGQFLVLDNGQRLGVGKTQFTNRFYYKVGMYKLVEHTTTKEIIQNLIGDMTLQMSAEDYNPLPDLLVNDIEVELPKNARRLYDSMEKELYLQLESGNGIELVNHLALMNKCFQFSNGAVYLSPESSEFEQVHTGKLEALNDIIEEANGKQVLCAYNFRSDAQVIMEHFKALRPINLTDCKTTTQLENAMLRWKNGDCLLMIGHPASMGHGIDGLQDNGNIVVWFGLNWSLDLYEQMNARIRRQGQVEPVICHRIFCRDTLDETQKLALDNKALTQHELRQLIKQYGVSKGLI